VFLFEQLVILSEPIDRKKGFSLTGYIYKNSIKVKSREQKVGDCRQNKYEGKCLFPYSLSSQPSQSADITKAA